MLGEYLGAAEQRALAALIAAHGGKVVAAPRRQTHFLVQSHAAEQCDERIEACCELGALGVPPSFVRACAAAGQLFPFREWAMVHPDRAQPGAGCFGGVSPYLNPRLDPALLLGASAAAAAHCPAAPAHETTAGPRRWLLGAKDLGNVDYRSGEYEELNQSVADYVLQKWPALGDEGRDTIYVQPMATQAATAAAAAAAAPTGGGGGQPSADPEDPALLRKVTDFLSAYFGCKVKALPPLPLLLRQKAPKKAKKAAAKKGKKAGAGGAVGEAAVRIEAAGVEVGVEVKQGAMHDAKSKSTCLSVLDLLDAMTEVLPGDAYCVLGITDQCIYEKNPDGHMLGRAFGGSRIAVFTTAVYGRALAAAGGGGAASAALRPLAHLLATIAHETGHCFGLDHCGLYRCCMNSWADGVSEFALEPTRPGRKQKEREWVGDVEGTMHMCPICVRKLQVACDFGMRQRYAALGAAYGALGLAEQVLWCREVIERGDATAAAAET